MCALDALTILTSSKQVAIYFNGEVARRTLQVRLLAKKVAQIHQTGITWIGRRYSTFDSISNRFRRNITRLPEVRSDPRSMFIRGAWHLYTPNRRHREQTLFKQCVVAPMQQYK